jgi:acetylornithine deacetylase/succinyl-diaminopimelate desuccinylase-like protein
MADHLAAVLDHLRANEEGSVARWMDWLRIPSVSTDPAYREHCRRAAEWCAAQLREAGFGVEIRDTADEQGKAGHPIVLAHTPGAAEYRGPHVLFYGHYDVQPADPLELWESPPFEPVIRDEVRGGPGRRVVARGAVDDKGQVMMFLEAMRAWKQVSGMAAGGVKMTVLIEGEEETGSVSIPRFIEEQKQRLGQCDICIISDTGMLDRDKPAITCGVRGLAYTEVTLHGPDQDLHSGLWGGRAPNPNNELVRILGQLWDEKRRVTIEGFYDDVRPIPDADRAAWRQLPFDAARELKKIGLPPEADIGEAGYTTLEREWGRPTAEINGIFGGYTGTGAKTVIPSRATAKVSFRLVADQDPAKIAQLFFAWLQKRTPPGCRWELTDLHGGPGVSIRTDAPALQAAVSALRAATGVEPALIRSGGSIPIAGLLKQRLGLETIFMGFSLPDDRVHSPNEKFELHCFRWGARSHAALVPELWETGAR